MQGLKRLITKAQEYYPTDPSRSIDYIKRSDSEIEAMGARGAVEELVSPRPRGQISCQESGPLATWNQKDCVVGAAVLFF